MGRPRSRKIITLDADTCRAEPFLECFKRMHGGKVTFENSADNLHGIAVVRVRSKSTSAT